MVLVLVVALVPGLGTLDAGPGPGQIKNVFLPLICLSTLMSKKRRKNFPIESTLVFFSIHFY